MQKYTTESGGGAWKKPAETAVLNKYQGEFFVQQKIIALAVAAAVSAPAFADATVYGLANVSFDNVHTSSVAAPAINASGGNGVVSNASRLGFKGTEELGNGLSALYQIETLVTMGDSNASLFAGARNSNVGLKGGFGTVFLGSWDTPFKVTHNKVELFDNATFASATDITGRTATATGSTAKAKSFVTRQSNSIQYWSPDFNGFQAKLAYGTDTNLSAATDNSVLSLSAVYENALFYAAYGHESKNDASFDGQTDRADRLVGAYKFDGGQVGLAYERLTVGTSATTNASRNGWELSGKYNMDASSNIGAFYTRAGDIGTTASSGAKQVALRYGYKLSRRTELYGMYSRLSNDANAKYTFAAGGTPLAASNAGAALSGLGAGMIHTF